MAGVLCERGERPSTLVDLLGDEDAAAIDQAKSRVLENVELAARLVGLANAGSQHQAHVGRAHHRAAIVAHRVRCRAATSNAGSDPPCSESSRRDTPTAEIRCSIATNRHRLLHRSSTAARRSPANRWLRSPVHKSPTIQSPDALEIAIRSGSMWLRDHD